MDKVNIGDSVIKLDKASIIQTKLHKEDVKEIVQEGNNLVIKLNNGEQITIENYFVKDAAGNTSDLVFEGTVCAFEQVVWENGAAGFKELTGLEELLPIVTGAGTGGVGPLPWVIGGIVAGGIGAAAGGSGGNGGAKKPAVLEAPKVEIENDKNNDGVLNKEEIGDATHINVIVTIPTGAVAGDTITVKDQNGKEYPHKLTQTDIDAGKVTVAVDIPAEGTDLKVTATIENAGGTSTESAPDRATVDTVPPTVSVTYDPSKGEFTVDFSDEPINPNTGKPFTPEEIKDLITSDPKNNLGPDTTVTVDPEDPTKFVVTPSPKDPSKDVTVEIPTGSYEDKGGNPGLEGTMTDDVVPPSVKVEITPDGKITVTFDPDVDPSTIDPNKDFVITDKDGNPLKDKDGNPVTVPPLTSTDGGITWTGKVPPNVDGEVKVEVPAGSYEDKTGNPGTGGDVTVPVDTAPPSVKVEITPNGDIKVTFDPDVDPSTIDPNTDIVITDKDGNPLKDKDGNPVTVPPLTSTDGGITWTGKVPPNVDGEVKVEVPAGSYDDKTGNPGTGGDVTVPVDTAPPSVKVEITPNGDIKVTFDPDVDPSTIDPNTDIVITDKDGNPLKDKDGNPVTVPPLTSTDGGITWTGKVPPNVDGEVKVEVPAGSYDDKTGNPGTGGDVTVPVETIPPSVKVEITPNGDIKVTFDPDVDPSTIDPNKDFVITDKDGNPLKDKDGNPVTVPPLTSIDGGITWTGKVPPNVDAEVKVEVPTGSYDDKTGNPGTGGEVTVPVDTA
ncbi:BapA prefix-like domain-containing protein, partial [Acinetobacter wuhouensis]|uniref:BapA/Bap/LapF family prefix-like domain-containing protein n=1 Tax=Acinetobacter wuhouensis TaxID=1879050 RepID=UPI0010239A3A